MNTVAPPLLSLTAIGKAFPGCVANDSIDITIRSGEIHALLGENGAGKSTLVKIIYGILRPDHGYMTWFGNRVQMTNPGQARELGIGMVFQHFSLFEALSTLENIALALPNENPKHLRKRLLETAEEYGLTLQPDRNVYELSMGERQRIEIIRCLLQDPKLLILDEPTSVLTPQETSTLFETLHRLASENRAILYISHKLEEVRSLCDKATILRGGRLIDECVPSEETARSLAEKMIGARINPTLTRQRRYQDTLGLEVNSVTTRTNQPKGISLTNIDLEVRRGEILGIAGIAGNGQTELMEVLTGEIENLQRGKICMLGTDVTRLNINLRRDLGVVFLPEERIGQAAVADMTLIENSYLTAPTRLEFSKNGLINWNTVEKFSRHIIKKFDVRTTGINALASSLSGGNLQKFIIGREILQEPQLLIVSQPTWGVDAGAAAAIHNELQDLVLEGAAVLLISQDLDEIFLLSDRIAVISEGTLSSAKSAEEITADDVGLLMGIRHTPDTKSSYVAT